MVTHRIADEGHQEMMGYPAGERRHRMKKEKRKEGVEGNANTEGGRPENDAGIPYK